MRRPSEPVSGPRGPRAHGIVGVLAALALCADLGLAHLHAQQPKFFPDDPLLQEPDSQDASDVKAWDIPLGYDLAVNLFSTPGTVRDIRALDVNTVDEVPDSSWFTNRIGSVPISIEALQRGPVRSPGPAPGRLTVVRAKSSGVTPGFVLRDSAGVVWFVQFNAPTNPEGASAASMIANRLFWALGYFQAENHIATIRVDELDIDPRARVETPSGRERPLAMDDLKVILGHADRAPDFTYRMLASRAIPGRILGGFKYHGTRPDDPNDVIPHEHRRVLRALKVFGAWTNLVDMKAGNTLDSLVTEDGRSFVRHYLQDVGSTFGVGALGPREWDEGYEYIFEGAPLMKRLFSLGLYIRPWQTVPYEEFRATGRFEGDRFVPEDWRPRVPTTALKNVRADDAFWAARRVMAFTDEMIAAVVKVGQISDPAAEAQLAEVLMKRRDKIGRAYYTAINPLVDFALAGGRLTFVNEALRSGVVPGPAPAYDAEWYRFDNGANTATPLATTSSTGDGSVPAPPALAGAGPYVRVDVRAVRHPIAPWTVPVRVYFRRHGDAWTLVGLERQP